MSRFRIAACALVLCSALGAAAVGPSPALASRSETVFFEAPRELLSPTTRPHAMAQLKYLGVRALRVELSWHEVAPAANAAKRPSFNATSPASYNWGQYAPLLAEAHSLHWQVLLTVTGPAPKWATAGHKDLLTRPDDLDFQQFTTAVARQFGQDVTLYAIWNEPNDPVYLRPQFNANGTPASGRIYRGLFEAGYAGLKAAGVSHPKLLFGETEPTGYDKVSRSLGPLHDVAPLAFLREALCLNKHYKRSGTCGSVPAYGYAHHAYTTAAGPFWHPPEADDVTIGVLSRLTRALNLAARAHALRGGIPIYLTEFGIQSKPNRYLGVPVAQQAEYDAMAEHIAYQNSRVAAFSQYLLRDDPLSGPYNKSVGSYVGFQTGLEYENGKPKPLYYGFPVPLVVSKQGRRLSLWGLVRPAAGRTTLTVEVQRKGSKRYRKLAKVSTNGSGYWSLRSSTQGSHWRVRWVSPTGTVYQGPPVAAH